MTNTCSPGKSLPICNQIQTKKDLKTRQKLLPLSRAEKRREKEKMNLFRNEKTTDLLVLLNEMVAHKKMLLDNGLDKIAKLDDLVIAEIMAELDSRNILEGN